MVNNESPKDRSATHPLLKEQASLAKAIFALSEEGRFSDAIRLTAQAAASRDELVTNRPDVVQVVEISLGFSEILIPLLEIMVDSGQGQAAKSLVASRLRATACPYEASSLHYWVATHYAQEGSFKLAKPHAKRAEEIAEGIGSPWLAAQFEHILSRICGEMGEDAEEKEALIKALDTIERAPNSTLYIPESYKLNSNYGVKHRLRYYLGQRLFQGREREARNFCNEVLAGHQNPSRLGFFHHWMGQAEVLHLKPLGESKLLYDGTAAFMHLEAAERYFVAANEPIYAAAAVLDQAYIHSDGAVAGVVSRAEAYIEAAAAEYEATGSEGLAMEIEDVMRVLENTCLRLGVSSN